MVEIFADETLTPSERLIQFAGGSLTAAHENTKTMRSIFQALALPGLEEILAHDFEKYYEEFTSVLATLFEALGDSDPRATASLFIGAVDGLTLHVVLNPDFFDQKRMIEQLKIKFNLEAK